ncbi:unnamed protein product (macronuclear) [Paramecium tetraurelia]|uniref:t-SNARE coiled-coil homology domain-containing protein n=1 Tax=Paramecium tetraurelia TaxID=5888 RepID=A0CX08_PARTE|nr:uncharacterized protein GSPATT00001528001 [Paramecium tetraurelia]CAK75325.1 unnamed protein product [Paramecium tetraurelia]|eukprot:XP_001442722.1 hypothetical protein (macronuclear) [Paramecium tetraurelia strain d4-2]
MQRSIGYIKNRTKELQLKKQKYKSPDLNSSRRIYQLPPKWVDKMEETRDTIQKVGILNQEIERLKTSKDVGPKAQFNEQLHYRLKSEYKNLQIMETDDCENDLEYKIKQNAKMCLGISLKEVTPQLRSYQNQMMRQVQLERPAQNFKVDFEQEYIETLILDRNDRIKSLGEKLKKMNELFIEMNRLVIEQGTLLDRIDFNIDQTFTRIQKGKQQLVQANTKQETSDRAQKCICVLVGLNIFIAFLFVIKHTLL